MKVKTMKIRRVIASLLALPVVIFCLCAFVKFLVPEVTVEPATVLSSYCGVVTMQTDDGNIYKCYGETDATKVDVTLEDGRFVHFEER